MKKIYYLLLGIMLISSISCNKQDWDEESSLSLRLESDISSQISIINDFYDVTESKLEIAGIMISGKRIQSDDIAINYTETVELDFINPNNLTYSIKIPVGTYEDLKATLIFNTDSSVSFINGDISSSSGQGDLQSLMIPLNFSKVENLVIFNAQDEGIVLIDDETTTLNLSINFQKSFENINESLWNGLMNANQSQSEVDLNSVVGAEFTTAINTEIQNNIQLKILK